jgi:hypothetical protein
MPLSAEDFFDDLLLAVPLFIKDGTDYRFIHKSIGEFFAAEFIAYATNSKGIIEKIRDSKSYKTFLGSLTYLAEINPNLFAKLIVAPLAKNVLKEKQHDQNPYVRSVNFLYQGYIRITNSISNQRAGASHNINYGTGSGKDRYRVQISLSDTLSKPTVAAWRLITKVSDIQSKSMFGNKKSELHKVLPIGKWINLKSKKILNNISHPDVINIFYVILYFETFEDGERSIRILDNDTCKSILNQIKQEEDTQKWVTSLISNK